MSFQLIPLCSTPKQATRDGLAGGNASFILPYAPFGRWWASGKQFTFANSTVPQSKALTLGGRTQVDTYQKDCCNCLNQGGSDMTYVAP